MRKKASVTRSVDMLNKERSESHFSIKERRRRRRQWEERGAGKLVPEQLCALKSICLLCQREEIQVLVRLVWPMVAEAHIHLPAHHHCYE